MLRRKMILILGTVVAMLVAMAVVAIWLLQGILSDLYRVNAEAAKVVEAMNELTSQVARAEMDMYEMDLHPGRRNDELLQAVKAMSRTALQLDAYPLMHAPPCDKLYQRMMARLPALELAIRQPSPSPEASPGTAPARRHNMAAASDASALRKDILEITHCAQTRVRDEQFDVARQFRNLVLALCVVSLVVVNLFVLALFRVTTMVLRPVESLTEASRQLAQEHFDHRVVLDERDEFDELGRSFNRLAEQLQANEERKLETLGHVALTLNHELNNALGVIELQLRLMARQASGDPALEKSLRQIHEALRRMTHAVDLLKNARRIVLTDYVSGVKMLDLERSAASEPAMPSGLKGEPAAPTGVAALGAPGVRGGPMIAHAKPRDTAA